VLKLTQLLTNVLDALTAMLLPTLVLLLNVTPVEPFLVATTSPSRDAMMRTHVPRTPVSTEPAHGSTAQLLTGVALSVAYLAEDVKLFQLFAMISTPAQMTFAWMELA